MAPVTGSSLNHETAERLTILVELMEAISPGLLRLSAILKRPNERKLRSPGAESGGFLGCHVRAIPLSERDHEGFDLLVKVHHPAVVARCADVADLIVKLVVSAATL